jgi:TonB family protein
MKQLPVLFRVAPAIIRGLFCGLALGFYPAFTRADPATSQNAPATPAQDAKGAPASAVPTFVPPRAIPSTVMKNWPVYTVQARQAHREGIVLLSVTISADGTPMDVKIARSSQVQDLDVAAIAAVRNWRFTPATRDGITVETTVNLPVNFSLKSAEKTVEKTVAPEDTKNLKPASPKPKAAAKKLPKPATPKPAATQPPALAPASPPAAASPEPAAAPQ